MTTSKDGAVGLLPCPFCGGEAEIDTLRAYARLGKPHVGHHAAIYCIECSAEIAVDHEDFGGYVDHMRTEITAAWNRRTAFLSQSGEGDATDVNGKKLCPDCAAIGKPCRVTMIFDSGPEVTNCNTCGGSGYALPPSEK